MEITLLEWLKSVNIQDPEMICDELAKLDVLTVPHLIRSSELVKDNIRRIMTRISAKRFDKALEDVEETMGLNSLELSEQCASLNELKSQIELENMCIESLNKLLSSPIPTRHLTAEVREQQTKCRVRLTEAKKAHQERAIRLNRIMSCKVGGRHSNLGLTSDTNSDPEVVVKQKQSKCLTVSFDEATLLASAGGNHKHYSHLLTSSDEEEEVVRLKELRNSERMRLDALKEQSDCEQMGHNSWKCRHCGSGNHESQFKCPSCSARKPAWYDSIPQFVYQRNHHSRTYTKNQNPPALSAFPSVDSLMPTVPTTSAPQSPSYFEMIKNNVAELTRSLVADLTSPQHSSHSEADSAALTPKTAHSYSCTQRRSLTPNSLAPFTTPPQAGLNSSRYQSLVRDSGGDYDIINFTPRKPHASYAAAVTSSAKSPSPPPPRTVTSAPVIVVDDHSAVGAVVPTTHQLTDSTDATKTISASNIHTHNITSDIGIGSITPSALSYAPPVYKPNHQKPPLHRPPMSSPVSSDNTPNARHNSHNFSFMNDYCLSNNYRMRELHSSLTSRTAAVGSGMHGVVGTVVKRPPWK